MKSDSLFHEYDLLLGLYFIYFSPYFYFILQALFVMCFSINPAFGLDRGRTVLLRSVSSGCLQPSSWTFCRYTVRRPWPRAADRHSAVIDRRVQHRRLVECEDGGDEVRSCGVYGAFLRPAIKPVAGASAARAEEDGVLVSHQWDSSVSDLDGMSLDTKTPCPLPRSEHDETGRRGVRRGNR